MSLWEIILLSIVQGLTEFLPVSSSGHLVVANSVLEALGSQPVKDLVEVSIVLHLGTLASVLVHYRREVWRLLGEDRRVIGLLIVGTIPAAVVGVSIKLFANDLLDNLLLIGCMFPMTAAMLVWAMRRRPGKGDYTQMSWHQAFTVGVLQAIAILPGISRSGSTIAAGLGIGLSRSASTTFAFLLAIPAIAGAGVLEGIDVLKDGSTGTPLGMLAVGFVISFAVGLFALRILIRWVESGRLAMFAYYLVPLGIAVIGWQLLGY